MPTSKPLPPSNEFHIQFDQAGISGYIKSVKVVIMEDIVDRDETVRIDLRDHPLYPALFKYCLNNPPTK